VNGQVLRGPGWLRLDDELWLGGVRLRLGATAPEADQWLRWNGGTVLRIARHFRATGDAVALAVLADALEEAGCADADILGYCRGPGECRRDCWVIRLLLGKS
jgi:hypothetical protein